MSLRLRHLLSLCVALGVVVAGAAPAFAAKPAGRSGGGVRVSVTNPGSQVSSTGQPVGLQIQASDSNGGALSYAATGLPAGLTIGATTGLVSGTSTVAQQTSVTVTVTDTVGGATAHTSFGWTVNAAYDVSYPQCSTALPAPAATSLVGVNDGIVYSANPCLAAEISWGSSSGSVLQLYANTADPGPAYSSHWPVGQQSPEVCSSTDTNSTACSYDYGFNAAQNSFGDAAGTMGAAAASATWWFDVETGNSWETLESKYGQTAASQQADVAALEGAVYGLQQEGVQAIGFYSTSYQWGQITGGTGSTFAANPAWLAGYSSLPNAQAGCTAASFTGGPVTYTQYSSGGLDADFPC